MVYSLAITVGAAVAGGLLVACLNRTKQEEKDS
jgi:outer membrane murein-binding lipoprotein Lpp